MATTNAPSLMETAPWRRKRKAKSGPSAKDLLVQAGSLALRITTATLALAALVALALALISYHPGDPSFNNATDITARNFMGLPGAYVSDLLLQGLGLASILFLPLLAGWSLRLFLKNPVTRPGWALAATIIAVFLGAAALGLLWPSPVLTLDAGSGGVLGLTIAHFFSAIPSLAGMDNALILLLGGIVFGLLSIGFLLWGLLPSRADWHGVRQWVSNLRMPWWQRADYGHSNHEAGAPAPRRPAPETSEQEEAPPRRIIGPAPRKEAAKKRPARQPGLALGDRADLPDISLLEEAQDTGLHNMDEEALEQNARLLESVLEDYGVKGRIIGLAQGPVVTLYELEPAPGIKASRVIGLADDIARSMSAVSARVAVIPGRNVIGIELPNIERDMVSLSEMIEAPEFQKSTGTLPIVLGKDIAGSPVVTDLAPMPHLLIAGTTGSGKSVGLNAMILSLLYRLRPDQCSMIMIDPKMLELSVYDDIPHLLAPVVTEPQKAVRALKWAVEQMEERYRNMAHINVRSLSSYNEKVREAVKTGEPFIKRVQTGWDEEGQPEFEEVSLPLEPLPLIVIIVDELADLMMTAGKEVEFLIQRLAQKARAAGIHLIMATQRPSVDVITGVIKANLPTRISFQVTSKIDSRTILGEQGAEQLLGKGDMLYMPGGKQVIRVHGPFVSDEEVEAVAEHWKAQGSPDYIQSVTEEPEGGSPLDGLPGMPVSKEAAGDDQLQQAIQIVATSRRATISYVQRQLRVGYNTAARLIEQMEDLGLISSPDHVGRREVLMDEAGERLP